MQGNYGGMLQAYALRKALEMTGKKIELMHYATPEVHEIFHNIPYMLADVKTCVKLYFGLPARGRRMPFFLNVISGRRFASKYMGSPRLVDWKELKKQVKETDAIVAGSDQVWRCHYNRDCMKVGADFFFLSHFDENVRRRSITYAASFGTDEWEGTPEETEACGRLLRQFKAVSARERSGIDICREKFRTDAVQMPDPTLLLKQEDYDAIISNEKTRRPEGRYIAAYLLDEDPGKLSALHDSSAMTGMSVQHLMPHATAAVRRDRFPISPAQWLRYIRDCDYMVTDSFHGCVFAIIFNKPFVCLGNQGRGMSRFDSLLETFHLENRVSANAASAYETLIQPIDWESANDIHDKERDRGIRFLKENLK